MRLGLERRHARVSEQPSVVEIVTPRTNAASLTSAENLFAAIGLTDPFAFEVAADNQSRRFLIRAGSASVRQHLEGQLGAAYPQAVLRPVELDADPARMRPGEQVHVCTLELRAPAYLPIRTFSDLDIDGDRASQADPVLGVLNAMGDVPPGWRALSQLVLQPAADDWCRDYVRLSVQHPLASERVARPGEHSTAFIVFVVLLLGLGTLGLQAYRWFVANQWWAIVLTAAVVVGAAVFGRHLLRALIERPLYDMDLVREKVSRVAYRAELRLAVFAPDGVEHREVHACLGRFAAAYRHFNLAAGNGFRARPAPSTAVELWTPRALSPKRRQPILTTRELAGLWHLPHQAADVALLERTTARRWLPLPASVASGCRIGVASLQGREVAVSLPDDVLRRHMLLVAKTRRGKSTLLLRLARHAMQRVPRGALLLVDPHRDLAEAALGLVPPERAADVVYLDVANQRRPFGLNVLDTGLGWERDRAVANALTIFQREWGDRFWGPRMEDAFRFALLSLFEANAARSARDGDAGRQSQFTLLEVPRLFGDTAFRRSVLADVADPTVHQWWSDYFGTLDRRLQLDVINPVLSKIHRFQGSTAARLVVGQAQSTIDPSAWLRDQAIVIVNTARGTVGENAAALLGGTILNLTALAVAAQARLEPAARASISILVDEFHTLPGADYESILAELNKYGANLVLATQSLGRLLNARGDDAGGLRATVFANLDGLFAFNCSAEDARYLAPELGGAIDEQDLLELGEHQCYVRLSSARERLPTFSVTLDPPLDSDPQLRAHLTAESALCYGRVPPPQPPRTEVHEEPEPTVEQPQARNEHRSRGRRRGRQLEEAGAHA